MLTAERKKTKNEIERYVRQNRKEILEAWVKRLGGGDDVQCFNELRRDHDYGTYQEAFDAFGVLLDIIEPEAWVKRKDPAEVKDVRHWSWWPIGSNEELGIYNCPVWVATALGLPNAFLREIEELNDKGVRLKELALEIKGRLRM